MGISDKLRAAGKASEAVLSQFFDEMDERDVASAAMGYVEYSGSPVGLLRPDFAGQVCLDTVGKVFYKAKGTTVLDWALASGAPRGGYRTALFGDSMTDFNFSVINPNSVSYNPLTNQITVTYSSQHNMAVGQTFKFWNRSYASLYKQQYLTVTSVTSLTVFVATLNAGTYPDLPNGALAGTSFYVPYNYGCSKSWLQWINALANQRFDIVLNAAQSGDTTLDCVARIGDVLSVSPEVVVMQAPGINDFTYDSLTTRNDYARTVANLALIFDAFRYAGVKMIVGTVTPVASGEARAQKSIMVLVQRLNEWIWNYARTYGGMVVIDAYANVISPTDASGLATANYLNATDKIHFSNVGGYVVGKNGLAAVLAAFPSFRSTLPSSTLDSRANSALTSPTATAASNVVTVTAAGSYIEKGQEVFIRGATGSYAVINGRQVSLGSDGSGSFRFLSASAIPDGAVAGSLVIAPSRNLFPDPLLQTATGGTISNGVTGTAAGQLLCSNGAGNTGTLTCAASVAAEANGFGNEQLLTVTAAASGDQPRVAFKNSVGTVENQMTPGRTYVAECQVRLASSAWGSTPISELTFSLTFTANGSTENWVIGQLTQLETAPQALETSGSATILLHLRTPPITIPAGATLNSCQWDVRAKYSGAQAAGTMTMGVSRIAVRDVTQDYSGLY